MTRKTLKNNGARAARAFIMLAVVFSGASASFPSNEIFSRAEGSEVIRYADGREYYNYKLLAQRSEASSLPTLSAADILLDSRAESDIFLHYELLARMYNENMRRVFFIAEITPYYPGRKYDALPWGRNTSHIFFGNAFWRDESRVGDAYRRVYGTSSMDFNDHMRRVRLHREMESTPRAFVFARLERTGANSQWRNVWGMDHYYYFIGTNIHIP